MTIKSILENLFSKIEDAANYNITEIMFKPISLFDNTYINAIKTNPKKDRFYIQLSNIEENEKIYTNFYIVDNNFLTDALSELNQYIINDTTNDDYIIRKMIEEKEGASCGDIIRQRGEDAFRSLETDALRAAGKLTGVILATGGGAVTRPENRDLLRQNGLLFHLDRGMDDSTLGPGRPLSDSREKWEQLYGTRRPLYEAWRDALIGNRQPEEAAAQILTEWERRAPGTAGL